jgi:hypothetical protein
MPAIEATGIHHCEVAHRHIGTGELLYQNGVTNGATTVVIVAL